MNNVNEESIRLSQPSPYPIVDGIAEFPSNAPEEPGR